MDEHVIAAMARWPDVPAVYGWLSLSEAGQWRLHPQGDALRRPASPGESISSPQILTFMDRNYAVDPLGQWYFQNGPQRVYVRLDAAPFIVHITNDTASGRLKLRTHTGLDVTRLQALHLDAHGRLYAATEHGAALVAGRDLPALLGALRAGPDIDIDQALADCLASGASLMLSAQDVQGFPETFPLHCNGPDTLEATLGFRRFPQAPVSTEPDAGRPASG